MTKTLTEQWRDGELDEGWYYVVIEWDDEIRMLYFEGDYFLDTDVPLDNDNIKEVLAPVPSYDEYKRLQEQLADANKALKQLVGFGVVTEETKAEYKDPDDWECTDVAQEYLDKWGVK